MKRQLTAAVAALVVAAPLSMAQAVNQKWLDEKAADNMSMMEYARKNHERLSKHAVSFNVDPNATPWAARWTYHMPDGSVVSCLRGVLADTFIYECKEF